MSHELVGLFAAMAPLGSAAGGEGPLRDWLASHLMEQGADVSTDALGNLLARAGGGGPLVLCALDEPTFFATGTGHEGRGVVASGTALGLEVLSGRRVRSAGGHEALLQARAGELLLDPLSGLPEVGEAFTFAQERRAVEGALVGPDAGRRSLICAVLAALKWRVDFTLLGLARAGFSPQGGQDLLLRSGCSRGVALDLLEEEDEHKVGCGPVLLARSSRYVAPERMRGLFGTGRQTAVRPELRSLAARLQPAGIEGLGICLPVRYLGGDQERIAYQDVEGLRELLKEALAPS